MKRAGWLLLGLAAPQKQVDQAVVGIIQRTPLIEPEYKDTVCRENCPAYYLLMASQDVLEAMSLRSLTHGELPAKVFLMHRIEVSIAFYTVVVAYQPSKNEIRNYLVTYSRQSEHIDMCLVAADAIAEGLLKVISMLRWFDE